MITDYPLCMPKNSYNLTQWKSQKSDDFKKRSIRNTTTRDATKYEVQKKSLIPNFW